MTPKEFNTEIKNGIHGFFLLCGEEVYLRAHSMSLLRSSLLGGDAAVFGHERIFFDESSLEKVAAALEAMPLMSETRLVEISGVNFVKMKDSAFDEFCSLVKEHSDDESLVCTVTVSPGEIDFGTQKKPDKKFAALSKILTPVVFGREQPAALSRWLYKHFLAEGISIAPQLCDSIVKSLGCDMSALSNAAVKICAYVKSGGRGEVTKDDIAENITDSIEIAAFDFDNAVVFDNLSRSLEIFGEQISQGRKESEFLGSILRIYSNLALVKNLSDAGLCQKEIASKLKIHEYTVSLYIKFTNRNDTAAIENCLFECYNCFIASRRFGGERYRKAAVENLLCRLHMIRSAK